MLIYYYTYILLSLKDFQFYTGYSADLRQRFADHQAGKVKQTKNRRPLVLICYEACLTENEARKREIYLKSAWGKRYLKNRLKDTINLVLPR